MFSHTKAAMPHYTRRLRFGIGKAVIASLENQDPLWSVGTHGYHPRTIGFLADEIVRRVDGRPLGQFWREEIAAAGRD